MKTTLAGPIRLFVLGDARIETPLGQIEPTAEVVFAAALYLILERREPVARRTLAGVLWPKAPSTTASHRLRQTLLKLRRAGIPLEPVGKTRLSLGETAIWVDVEDFLRPQDSQAASPFERYALMPGYEPGFSAEFLDWLDGKKRGMSSAMTRVLLSRLSRQRLMGQWADVERTSSTLLELAPYNEEATLALAEAYAMRGSKLEGVRILDSYLSEIGTSHSDLRLPATVMRKRIVDRMPPRAHPSSGEIPLVGRSEEMEKLSSLLHAVRSGEGKTLLLWGDAGIGKTRLLTDFAAFASLQGVSVVRTQCRATDSIRPLSAFVDLVPSLRALRGAIGCSPETIKYLDRIATHRPAISSTFGLQGEAAFVYARVQQALFDLVDAVSDEAALLILIEDIHSLDDISGSLLADLVPWAASHPILFAFTGRDREYPWIDRLGDQVVHRRLPPLDHASAEELMLAAVRQHRREISPDYMSWCIKVAEGNPYFLAELASHWIETGEPHGAPSSLTSLINQRIGRLSTPTLQLLQTCSLLGKHSTIDRIEKVLGFDHHDLLRSINELGSTGMLILESDEAGSDPAHRLLPRHELLSNAAQNGLALPARAFLHRRIGTVLEAEISENRSAAILWDCAKHWQMAGNVVRAFAVARSYANYLMEVGLCSAAAEAYEKTQHFCTSDPERLEILEAQAHAYFRSSDWQHLAEVASSCRRLKRHLQPDSDGHDDIELMNLRALWQDGSLDETMSQAIACLSCITASNDHRAQAGIMALMLLDLSCDQDAMRHIYGNLLPLVDRHDADPALRFEAAMVFETVCGDLPAGVRAAENLIEARRHSESIADFLRALTNGAVAARTAGEVDLAYKWLTEAIALANSHKLPLATEVPIQLLASIALDLNQISAAREWYNKLMNLPRSQVDTSSTIVRDSIGLRIALSVGDVAEARRLAHSDLADLVRDPIPHRRTYGLALVVAVELAEDREPSIKVLQELEQAHLASRRNSRQAFATFVLVAALRRVRRRAHANRLLQDYLESYRREPLPAPLHLLELLESFRKGSASK